MVIISQIFYVETDSFKKRSAQWSLRRVEPRIIEKNLSLNSSKTIVLLVRLGVKCRIVWQNEQKIPHVFICTWFQLHMNPLIFWLSSVAPWPHSQTMTYRVSCPATPGDFKLSPYCSTYQRRLGSKMWGWKLATLEKQRSNQLIFAFGQRHSKRPISSPIHTHKKEVPNTSPCPFLPICLLYPNY